MLSFLKAWMLSFFMVYHICYHFWSTGCYLFSVWYSFLGCYHLCYHLVLSFILCYRLMLSFFDVIIWCYLLMLSFLTVCKCYHCCVIIFPCTGWVLSFMLSFNVIIFCYLFPPFFFFLKTWHTQKWSRYYRFAQIFFPKIILLFFFAKNKIITMFFQCCSRLYDNAMTFLLSWMWNYRLQT
jgi:hypothetical protein